MAQEGGVKGAPPSYLEKENETSEPQFATLSDAQEGGGNRAEAAGGAPAEIPVAVPESQDQEQNRYSNRAGLDGAEPAVGSGKKGLWTKAKSATLLIKEKSSTGIKTGVQSVKRSASIVQGKAPDPPPPPYRSEIELPPAYPSAAGWDGAGPDPPPPSYEAPAQAPDAGEPVVPPTFLPPPTSSTHATPERPFTGHPSGIFANCGILCCALVVFLLIVAAWLSWIVVPVHWMVKGRHHVRDTYDQINCTVVAQNCYKKCSGCGCPDSCCGAATDCIRSSYFMSQTCVWLSMSKFKQLPDFSAEIEINDNIAAGWRPSASSLFSAGVGAAGMAIGGPWALGMTRKTALASALVLGGGALLAEAKGTSGGSKCSCSQHFEIFMLVEIEGRRVSKSQTCHPNDDRSICQSEEFKNRDKSCRTLEDMEEKSYCQLESLNRVGRDRTCFVNPDDPMDIEVTGSKGQGGGNIAAVITWSLFTVMCWIPFCCFVGKEALS